MSCFVFCISDRTSLRSLFDIYLDVYFQAHCNVVLLHLVCTRANICIMLSSVSTVILAPLLEFARSCVVHVHHISTPCVAVWEAMQMELGSSAWLRVSTHNHFNSQFLTRIHSFFHPFISVGHFSFSIRLQPPPATSLTPISQDRAR